MPKKVYHMENLDCANCAAKIESKFNALPQVEEAIITFATRQLRLTAEDPDRLIPELERIARTVESEVRICQGEEGHSHAEHCACHHGHHHEHHEHAEGCCCGHDHHHEHEHPHEHGHHPSDGWMLLVCGGLFLIGALMQKALPWGLLWMAYFGALYLALGLPILKTAGKNILRGQVFDENFLMSIATLGAFAIGDFPEAVGVMLFFRVGEFFEERAVERSREEIRQAVDLRPETVLLVDGSVIPGAQAKVGDVLLVRPGDRIPLDGVVLAGESRVDTAPITGEPVPIAVHPGDAVTSGCVNLSGQLTVRVEKILAESMVSRILEAVENAAASKPKIDRFITRFSRVYTPIVVGLAALVAVVPSVITGDWNYWVYTALSFLVMSCPCALVLSVPLAFFSGIGAGSKQGILFKGGLSMEALAQVKAVVMDKTGTLTQGNFVLQQVEGGDALLRLCAGLEQASTHPIAQSIVSGARARGLELPEAAQVEELAGYGIRGVVEGKTLLCGNEKLLERFSVALPEAKDSARTWVYVAVDGVYAGAVCIADQVKDGAAQAVQELQKLGVETAMLTGDQAGAAQWVGSRLGIRRVHARLLPEEKVTMLRSIRAELGPVMFVGDGINDAPVLSGADVGAAMGAGADAAIEAADVVFMTSQPQAMPEALRIARRTRQIVWQNVVFALAIKLGVMILGLLGYASMWAAVFADTGVAMLCILNSIRMLYKK